MMLLQSWPREYDTCLCSRFFCVEVCARNQQFTLIEIALERYPPGPPTKCWNTLTVKYLPPEYQHCPGVEGDTLKRSVYRKIRKCLGRLARNVAS